MRVAGGVGPAQGDVGIGAFDDAAVMVEGECAAFKAVEYRGVGLGDCGMADWAALIGQVDAR